VIPLDGPFYDQLAVGQALPRQPSVTVDDGMAALYQSWVGERLPMSLDAEITAAVTGRAGRLVSSGLVMQLSIGQSTTISRRAIANLFYRDVRLSRPVFIGESVATVVTVAGLADGSHKEGRARRGKVLVDIVTTASGEAAVEYQRCPMLPQADDTSAPGHDDDFGPGRPLPTASYANLVPREWDFSPLGAGIDWTVGDTIEDPTRDIIDNATGMVRLTHNLAMVHRDAEKSPYPVRLVYGGHVVGLAQASLSRVLPGMATVVGWRACDHTGPAFEGDLLSFRHTLQGVSAAGGGRVFEVRIEGFAHRDADDPGGESPHGGTPILDWTLVAVAP
jgi:2-methylfumaryl-CoA hydratase